VIADIDDALKELLQREIPVRKGEIEIAFDQPSREWSSQLNKPAVNLYLFDIKENVELRASEQLVAEKRDNGTIAIRRNPVRVDLFYLVTCWTRDVKDQHHLLSNVLLSFLRNPMFPEELLPERLKGQNLPVRIKAAQGEIIANITDLWSTLNNEMRPGIRLTVTISLEPHKPDIYPMVRSAELRFQQEPGDSEADLSPQSAFSHAYHLISGQLNSQKYSPSLCKLVLRESAQEISVNPEGEFIIARLQEGDYHVDVLVNGRMVKQQMIHVPSSSYQIEV
jgi:hypothetical protein